MKQEKWRLPFGANVTDGGVQFRLWAPGAHKVAVKIDNQISDLAHQGAGWFYGLVEGARAGQRYQFRLGDGNTYPDPASRYQPEGVHGASEVVDPALYAWSDSAWRGLDVNDLIIYELHVGTATAEGTFDSLHTALDHLSKLGVSAIELMPVAQFAGARNWGYDGVYPFAPAAAYGNPDALRRFVDAAHARGLGVILDVVYNHLGPEGNYLPAITGNRIFTEKHKTPWGAGINFDDEGAEAVREFFIQNALYWVHEFHIDGLRCDATHAIQDDSATHFLAELTNRVRSSTDKPIVFIAEDERNERLVVTSTEEGGLGFDAVWADDFHHQVRRHVAGDREGYFSAYGGTTADIAKTLESGWYYTGQLYTPNGHERGTDASDLPLRSFVLCIQNHDQVGNRAMGERLHHQIDDAAYRAASTLLLLAPHTPMLWMGQEWAATSPFLYFTDHPPELGELVTRGRREEFKTFSAFADPQIRERIPDPQSPQTFERSKLDWDEIAKSPGREMLAFYRAVIALRREEKALAKRDRANFRVDAINDHSIRMVREQDDDRIVIVVNFANELVIDLADWHDAGTGWQVVFCSESAEFGGSPDACALREDQLQIRGAAAMVLRPHLPS